jgi:hypothetical protein
MFIVILLVTVLEESHIEIVFSRDCITVRSPVVVPIKGKTWHEEKIGYGDIPVGGFRMNVISIDKQEEADRLVALSFKVSSFELARKELQQNVLERPTITRAIIELTPGCLQYHYVTIVRFRSLFPGYRVPFVLETDKGELTTHVSSAPKGSAYGDRKQGTIISNIRQWYLGHPELRAGSKILIEAIEPFMRYRLSIFENPSESQNESFSESSDKQDLAESQYGASETSDRLNIDDKQDLKALSEKLISWAQEKNLRAITRSDVKLFLLNSNIRLSGSLEQMLYRDVKLKYRWLPPWMKTQ